MRKWLMIKDVRYFLPMDIYMALVCMEAVLNMPQLPEGSAFIYGHTHIKVNEAMGKERIYGMVRTKMQ